jgi:HEPN domain-containing protein
MREEVKNWLIRAERDLKASRDSFNAGNYEWACFQAQQASEKSLKALYINKYKSLLKIHDLVLLAKKLNAPEDIVVSCSKINPSYVNARYPDLSEHYSEDDANNIINLAEKILEWTKKNL